MVTPNWANRTLFHADNLPVMRGMNSETVDLIATDPPFNKGRDFHATPDSLAAGAKFQDRWRWADDVEGDWIDQLEDDWPDVWTVVQAARSSWGDDLGAFLCFMAVRIVEMHRVLKPTGSLYLHCDPTASHYLKQLLDAVFGRRNFRNEIVWCYRGGGVPRTDFARKHDLILRYAKGKTVTFNVDAVRIPYSQDSADRLRYTARSFRPNRTYDNYEQNPDGKHPEDWWEMQPIMPSSRERWGYPTQKPLALYERIIAASSNPGDIVLDPFCGCATTPIAAERLGRDWVGIDIWDRAHDAVIDRLQREGLAADGDTDRLFTFGDVTYSTESPVRSDDGETAAPFLQVTERYAEPDGPKMSRAEMVEHLITQHGTVCQGCDRTFDDPRYLQLDHNTPRADGGINHITNRVLLCGPCNGLKSNIYTLSGLRRQNARLGYMAR